jgi:hypothetical protein
VSFLVDIKEDSWSKKVLANLLIDRTTGANIIWATDDYEALGIDYYEKNEIMPELITGDYSEVIQPRSLKSKQDQTIRTKDMAEVYTPSWVCNEQNNLIDEAWFERKNIFNKSDGKSWIITKEKIVFPKGKNWKDYVDEKRLEITCGEAPYLVSRYDTVTGEPIEVEKRIGLLDRKLRIVNENTTSEEEWLKWVKRAYQSIYGFEFQGDSLLLARENLLISFCDYLHDRFNRDATEKELLEISKIISWNIWQMDGITFTIPFETEQKLDRQISLFDDIEETKRVDCLIKDWRTNEKIAFMDLIQEFVSGYEIL